MIKLEINSQKELSISKSAKVFKGENLINSIKVTTLNPYIGDKRVADCEFNLHVVLPDKSYIVYPVTWSENSIPLTGFVPITSDITSAAQFLKLYIEITSGNTVIGKTNTVKLQVYDSPDEETSITPREQLEEQIEELEQELESASTLTEILEALKGTYDSVAERIAADEARITSNTNGITSNQSAVVSLTAALSGKLDNAPNSVSTSNIADGAVATSKISDAGVTTAKLAGDSVTTAKISNNSVTTDKITDSAVTTAKISNNSVTADKITSNAVTTSKLEDNSVTYAKLSTALEDIIDAVPDKPLFIMVLGAVSATDVFDSGNYCTLGGVYQFTALNSLAASIGVPSGSRCELRYINDYQVITVIDTQQIFSRFITQVAPTFQSNSWSETLIPAVTSLQTAVGTLQTTVGSLNSQLENALNGGA